MNSKSKQLRKKYLVSMSVMRFLYVSTTKKCRLSFTSGNSLFICFVLGFILPETRLVSQDSASYLVRVEKTRLAFAVDGTPKVVNYSMGGAFEIPAVTLIRSTRIQNELEFTSNQKAKINDFIDWYDRSLADIGRDHKKGDVKSVKKKLPEFVEKADLRLKECLLPHQLQGVEKIRLRLLLRKKGILKAVLDSRDDFDIELLDSEIKSLKETIKTATVKFEDESRTYKDRFWRGLMNELNKDQVKKLDLEFKKGFEATPFVAFMAQLQHVAEKGLDYKPKKELKKPDQLFNAYRTIGTFELSHDGIWKFIQPRADLSDQLISTLFARNIESLDKTVPELNLSAEQINILRSLGDNYNQAKNDLRRERTLLFPSGGKESMKWFDEKLKSLRKNIHNKFENTFSAQQIQALFQFYQWKVVHNNGLIHELLYGYLGDDLSISKDHRDAILRFARAEFKKLSKELIRFEEELFDKVMSDLQTENKKQFSELLDWRPKELYPSVFLLLQE